MRVCLLWDEKFKDEEIDLLQQHYKKVHKVDANNFFYKSIFKKEKGIFIQNKCARCEYFYRSSRDKKKFNFLEHYQLGGGKLFENTPINIRIFDGNLSHYSILFGDHSDCNNFYDPDDTIKNFLDLFSIRFVPRAKVQIKCTLKSVLNYQPPLGDGFVAVRDTRIWSTDVLLVFTFNDFVKTFTIASCFLFEFPFYCKNFIMKTAI